MKCVATAPNAKKILMIMALATVFWNTPGANANGSEFADRVVVTSDSQGKTMFLKNAENFELRCSSLAGSPAAANIEEIYIDTTTNPVRVGAKQSSAITEIFSQLAGQPVIGVEWFVQISENTGGLYGDAPLQIQLGTTEVEMGMRLELNRSGNPVSYKLYLMGFDFLLTEGQCEAR